MPVKITKKIVRAELERRVAQGVAEQKQRVIRMLMYIGEQCVNDARLNGSYTDRTGNLRGSTGYCVVDNGKIVSVSGFNKVLSGTDGPEKGRDFINELASGYPSGLVLILVAGMHYAAYVAARGYNVIDSAEILAERLIGNLKG